MHFITRFHPSPALVVAAIALLVSLAGTGVAAVALVPKNSVGSDQVINGSLRSVDFRSGEVLGGSDTVSRSFDPVNLASDKLATVATLPISKPGAYTIWAHAQVVSPTVSGGQCLLIAKGIPGAAGGTPDAASAPSFVDQANAGTNAPTLWMTMVHGFASTGGSIELMCGGGAHGAGGVRDIKITAVRLGGDKG